MPGVRKRSYRSGRRAATSREETGRRSEDSSRHLVREEMQLTNTRTRADHTHMNAPSLLKCWGS